MVKKFPRTVSVTLTEEQFDKLNIAVEKIGVTKTILLRKLVDNFLSNKENLKDEYSFYHMD